MLPDRRRMWTEAGFNGLLIGVVAALLAAAGAVLVGLWTVPVVVGGAVAFWWWSWRRWRRRHRLLRQGFPPAWRQSLEEHVAYYRRLDVAGRRRFEALVQVFLDEVAVLGVGCEPTPTDSLLVAASAAIPVFGFPAWEYRGLRSVLVRPHAFGDDFVEGPTADRTAAGMVTQGHLLDGAVILSLDALRAGYADEDARNVGLHEFAHLIDQALGGINGVPAGLPRRSYRPWLALMRAELRRGFRPDGPLGDYAYTGEEEFFAVACEHFFERPATLQDRHAELYRILTRIFRQDPLADRRS